MLGGNRLAATVAGVREVHTGTGRGKRERLMAPTTAKLGDTLLEEWLVLRAIFERNGVNTYGIELCRHAFYAGAACNMGILFSAPTEASFNHHYDALSEEIRAFKWDIKRIAESL